MDASAAVTSVQASTLVISFALGDGEGVTEAFEEELDDPQALTRRPQVATTAIKPLGEMALATAPLRVILGPVVSQGDSRLSIGSRCVGPGRFEHGHGTRQLIEPRRQKMRSARLVFGMPQVRALVAQLGVGVLAIVVGAGVLAVWSRLATGSFTRIFGIIPMWSWVLLVLAAALVAIVGVATSRYRGSGGAAPQGPLILVGRTTVGGSSADQARIANFEGGFRDVIWQYRGREIEGSGSEARPDIDPDSIEVELPPLCPRCQTGLLEGTTMVLRRLVWRCVACHWQRGSRERFATVAAQAELHFQGNWRRDLQDRGRTRR
ncbi:MAG TPA: hypothetical protein DCF65_12860 [Chloroflexi bacterium]|nr:hypothetical protein [Chloroflexota bacterium]